MIRFPTVLAGLALGAVLVPASAQDIFPVTSVKYIGRYDIATETFFPSDVDPDTLVAPGDADPVVVYDNSTTNGYFSTGAGGAITTNHHMDWGTLTTAFGQGAEVTEVRINYATNITAPNTPPKVRLRLYQGATGSGVQGTVIGDYIIDAGALSTGGYQGFTVDVTLPAAVSMADGPIGWSYNVDNPVGAPTNSTGPLLAGPPNAPGTGVNKGAPATGFGAYDRYNETTNAYVATILGASPVVTSFSVRLKGRVNGAPANPWVNYGVKQKVTLTGAGSATPGSVDNVITVKVNPAGKSFILVAGLSQADFFQPSIGLHFYAFPWLVQLAPIVTPPATGVVDLPAAFPGDVPVGTKIYMQAFGQNLANSYVNWSEGLEVTIQ